MVRICNQKLILLNNYHGNTSNQNKNKRTATSTGKPDQRQRSNKETPGSILLLKLSKSTPNKI